MEHQCVCENGQYCERFKRRMYDRYWEICRGVNVTPEQQAKYLALWDRQAKVPRQPCGCSGKK